MLRIVHGTIVSWSHVWNVDRVIFRLPWEQYGDVETMRRRLLGRQGFFINLLNTVGLKLTLYPRRQSIVRIGSRMFTSTCSHINLHLLGIIVPITHFNASLTTYWTNDVLSSGLCCQARECQNLKWCGGSVRQLLFYTFYFFHPYTLRLLMYRQRLFQRHL